MKMEESEVKFAQCSFNTDKTMDCTAIKGTTLLRISIFFIK